MIKDSFDVVNKMFYLNNFCGLSTDQLKRELFNSFENLFIDGGTIEYYNNSYENNLLKGFFNGRKINIGSW